MQARNFLLFIALTVLILYGWWQLEGRHGNRPQDQKSAETKKAEEEKKAEESMINVQLNAELTEIPGPADGQRKSMLRFAVNSIKLPEVKFPDELVKRMKEVETLDRERQRVFSMVAHLDLMMQISERGDVERSVASAKSAPADIRAEVESLGDDILDWLQAVSVPLPNRQMTHLETWTAKRPFAVLTPLTDLHFKAIDMTYTYLGVWTRNSREEALVELSGKLRSRDLGRRFGCRLEGRALIDLETGLVTMARTTVTLDLDLPFGQSKIPARGTMEINLTRELPKEPK